MALNVDVAEKDAAHPQVEQVDGTGDNVDHNSDNIVVEMLECDEDRDGNRFVGDTRDLCEMDQLDLLTS